MHTFNFNFGINFFSAILYFSLLKLNVIAALSYVHDKASLNMAMAPDTYVFKAHSIIATIDRERQAYPVLSFNILIQKWNLIKI